MRQKFYCIDCKNEISHYHAKRCRKCYLIWLRENSKNFNFPNRKGDLNANHRHGKTYDNHCIECKVLLGNYRSTRCKSCWYKFNSGINSSLFGKITHGKGDYYKNIWMRSGYEIKYAQYLDQNNWKWLYESKTFDLGNATYTPDFYLVDDDVYVEIKGYWRDDALLKYRLFRKIYPKIRIRVLTKKSLQKLGIL